MESETRTSEASDLMVFATMLLLLLMLHVCGVRHISSCAFVLLLARLSCCVRLLRAR